MADICDVGGRVEAAVIRGYPNGSSCSIAVLGGPESSEVCWPQCSDIHGVSEGSPNFEPVVV